MMKKIAIIFFFSFFLVGCGTVKEAQVKDLSNSNHTISEMERAKKIVMNDFKMNYNGCNLETIWYQEDYYDLEQVYKKEKGYDEVIIFNMKFKTNDKQKSLNPNSVYTYKVPVGKKYSTWEIIEEAVGQG